MRTQLTCDVHQCLGTQVRAKVGRSNSLPMKRGGLADFARPESVAAHVLDVLDDVLDLLHGREANSQTKGTIEGAPAGGHGAITTSRVLGTNPRGHVPAKVRKDEKQHVAHGLQLPADDGWDDEMHVCVLLAPHKHTVWYA